MVRQIKCTLHISHLGFTNVCNLFVFDFLVIFSDFSRVVWHRDVGLIHGEDVFFLLLFPLGAGVASYILSPSHCATPATRTTANTSTAAPQRV